MKLLALDSATDACSAALYIDGEIRERFEIAPRRHTQLLLPMTHSLLAEAGIGLSDLDLLAYAQGPGSFTGLRITVGTVQGLALGLDCPVIGISTLASLAARCLRSRQACQVAVAMDARMNQVYWGQYALDESGHCRELVADCLRDPEQVPRLAPDAWQVAGAGWLRYATVLNQASGLQPDTARIELYPHAEEVAHLAIERVSHGAGIPASIAQPVYLRQQVAEKMKPKRS